MAEYSLTAIFGLDSKGLQTGLKQLDKQVGDFADRWAKIALAAGVGTFTALAKGAVDLASRLSDTAANLGINVISLQALQAQHKLNGVSEEQLTKAIEKTKLGVIDAAKGNDKATAALAALGLKAQDLIKLPLDKQYAAIAQGAAKTKDANVAYNAVADLFGEKIGPKMMGSLIELGKVGLPGVTRTATEAGQVLSLETIAALDRAGDAIDEFKRKATIAVGEIIVNFRTEEGLKLLWLQLSKVVLNFGAGIVDMIYETAQIIGVVLVGTFRGVTNMFRDGLVESVKAVAQSLNKVLPDKMEINIGNLDEFKSSGRTVGEEITTAMANTKPLGLKQMLNEASTDMVDKQKTVVDAVASLDLKKPADQLKSAGKSVGDSIKDAAPVVAAAGPEVAKPIIEAGSIAAREIAKVFGTISRVGESYAAQSSASLEVVMGRLVEQLSYAQIEDRNRFIGPGGTQQSIAVGTLQKEIAAVQSAIDTRAAVRASAGYYGETETRASEANRVLNATLASIAQTSGQTLATIQRLAGGLAASGVSQPRPGY